MCRKARGTTRAVAIKTASFLKRCTVSACKYAVLAHASLATIIVAVESVSQHHTTSNWVNRCDHNTIKYLKTHVIFPWVAVGIVSLILSSLDSIVMSSFSYSKRFIQTLSKKKTQTRRVEETPADSPPRAPPRQQRQQRGPKGGNKHRLYPAITNFKVLGSVDT